MRRGAERDRPYRSVTWPAEQVAAMYAGRCDPSALVGEFRACVLLVPVTPGGQLWTAERGGVRWIYAFSGEAQLGAFLRARGEPLDAEHSYLRVDGERLLDVAVPQLGVPGGVALDVGSQRPVMFPPVAGVVPEKVAVSMGGGGFGGY